MSDLDIKVSQEEGRVPVTVLHVSGDIDANSYKTLDDKAKEIVDGGTKHILLDLTNITYMSSAGFRSMHTIHTALQESGGDMPSLKLLNPSDKVQRIMKAMGFDVYLDSFSDQGEAIAAF